MHEVNGNYKAIHDEFLCTQETIDMATIIFDENLKRAT